MKRRRSRMVAPSRAGRPSIMIRSGSPAAWASSVVIVRASVCGGGQCHCRFIWYFLSLIVYGFFAPRGEKTIHKELYSSSNLLVERCSAQKVYHKSAMRRVYARRDTPSRYSARAAVGAMLYNRQNCLIDLGATAEGVVLKALAENTLLFERIINAVHQHAPSAKLCFNTNPNDTVEAVQRWGAARTG